MNGYQQLDQSLSRIYDATRILVKIQDGNRETHLKLIMHEANLAFGLMDESPDELGDTYNGDFKKLSGDARAALQEIRRKGGGRQESIAYRLSRVYHGANGALIQIGQAI